MRFCSQLLEATVGADIQDSMYRKKAWSPPVSRQSWCAEQVSRIHASSETDNNRVRPQAAKPYSGADRIPKRVYDFVYRVIIGFDSGENV